jgi:hypothetical protein
MAELKDSQEIHKALEHLEEALEDIRTLMGQRMTILTNANKKLQEFQDSIYAMLIEDEHPSRRSHRDDPDDDVPSSETS